MFSCCGLWLASLEADAADADAFAGLCSLRGSEPERLSRRPEPGAL